MQCTSCGQQIPENSEFCLKCGHRQGVSKAVDVTEVTPGVLQTESAPSVISLAQQSDFPEQSAFAPDDVRSALQLHNWPIRLVAALALFPGVFWLSASLHYLDQKPLFWIPLCLSAVQILCAMAALLVQNAVALWIAAGVLRLLAILAVVGFVIGLIVEVLGLQYRFGVFGSLAIGLSGFIWPVLAFAGANFIEPKANASYAAAKRAVSDDVKSWVVEMRERIRSQAGSEPSEVMLQIGGERWSGRLFDQYGLFFGPEKKREGIFILRSSVSVVVAEATAGAESRHVSVRSGGALVSGNMNASSLDRLRTWADAKPT